MTPNTGTADREAHIAFYDPSEPFYQTGRPSMEERILDGARRCLLQYGADKMSLGDVARTANIARNSIYKYFNNRSELVAAVVAWATGAFGDDVRNAVATPSVSFEADAVQAASILLRWRNASIRVRWAGLLTENEEAFFLSERSGPFVQNLMSLLRPSLVAAQRRGEVRARLLLDPATEWVARQLLSLSSIPAQTFDAQNLLGLDEFVRHYVVGGLLARPTPRTRRTTVAIPSPSLRGDWSSVPIEVRHPTELRILLSARECLFRSGATKMTLEDVAKGANVSRGSVHAYFTTRDDLVRAVFDYGRCVLIEDLDRAMTEQKTIEAGIVAASVLLSRWNQEVDASGMIGAELKARTLTLEGRSLLDPLIALLTGHFDRAAAQGQIRPELKIDRCAESVGRFLASIPTVPAQTFNSGDPESLSEFVRDFVVRGLR